MPLPLVSAQSGSQPKVFTKILTNPGNVSNLALTTGTVSFEVDLFNATLTNGFQVSLQYNYNVLRASSIDFTGGLLGSDAFALFECIDGQPFGNSAQGCTSRDGLGVVTLALARPAGFVTPPAPPAAAPLFTVAFVIGSGFSQIHFLFVLVGDGYNSSNQVLQQQVLPVDGYFTNIACPSLSSNLCKPPVPDFTVSPAIIVSGRLVSFNATLSRSQNPISVGSKVNVTITSYAWDWGDASLSTQTGAPLTTHLYLNPQDYILTLTVTDSYGITGSKSVLVHVARFFLDLTVSSFSATPQLQVYPGTLITIQAQVTNLGTRNATSTLEISIEGRVLLDRRPVFIRSDNGVNQSQATWDTTGFTPRAYRIDALVSFVRNSTTGQIIENVTSNNLNSLYVQLIEPPGRSLLSLGLLPTASLGIIVVIGVGFGGGLLSRLRRKVSGGPEEAEPASRE